MNDYNVYVHITPSKKLYIGIAKHPESRWRNGGANYKHNDYFCKAIQKYGWNNIQHIVIITKISREMACECEKYLIAKYSSNNPDFGYNLTGGGEGALGRHPSLETRAKIGKANSIALKGRKVPEEVKVKLRGKHSAMKGKHHTEEAKRKNSEAHKGKQYHLGYKVSEASRKRMSDSHKGQILSEKNKLALLEACANARKDPEKEAQRREKIRQAHLGKKKKPWSPEAREAHRIANEKRKQNKNSTNSGLYSSRT